MASQAHNPYGFRPLHAEAQTVMLPIKTTQTLAEGDLVLIDTLQVAICLAASTALIGSMAQPAVLKTAGVLVPVWGVANPHEIFYAKMDGDSSALGIGSLVDMIGATSVMELDASASAVDLFTALYAFPDQAPATADCQWAVIINPAKHQAHL